LLLFSKKDDFLRSILLDALRSKTLFFFEKKKQKTLVHLALVRQL